MQHPLAQTRLTAMRDAQTDSASFRFALHELTTMLTYEASRTFEAHTFDVATPVAVATGTRLKNPPLIVPVLRAGLGMADAALALLPESSMGFVGLARDEHTFEPRAYMESLPETLTGIPVLVLVDRGCTDITVLCALTTPEAIARLEATGMPMRLVTASIDDGLTSTMFITPGLGDAGDRQFGGMPRF